MRNNRMKIIKPEDLQKEIKSIPAEMGWVSLAYVKEAIRKCTINVEVSNKSNGGN